MKKIKYEHLVDVFDDLYASIKNKNALLTRMRFYSLERFVLRTIANFILPVYFKITSGKTRYPIDPYQSKKERIVVTLTSFPSRIDRLWVVVESLIRQTYQPDIIVLWLSRDQFSDKASLPKNLLRLEKHGLKIELVDDDLRSHKKYFYALQHFPDDIMITVDDDIIYRSNTIDELMKGHQTFPSAIIARYASKIKIIDNDLAPYKLWESDYDQKIPNFSVFFGSGGGTLFPPHSLPVLTLNKELFMDLCFYADDIWLNTMCRLNNTKIFKIKPIQCSLLPVLHRNNVSLSMKNLTENLNDKQLKEVRGYFIKYEGVDPYLAVTLHRV